ncbi:MAG: hypothetical protein COA47_10295 [Robiginitomaculum sp.]|nr:MAG: hypothetical protein COA47_10295 [Robiginitomaculum sp.]
MKFIVRENERVSISSEVFATKEEAAKQVGMESVSFVADGYAKVLGFPCGGYIAKDVFGKPLEIHVQEVSHE